MGNWILLYWKIAPFLHCCNIQLLPESYIYSIITAQLFTFHTNIWHKILYLVCVWIGQILLSTYKYYMYIYIHSFVHLKHLLLPLPNLAPIRHTYRDPLSLLNWFLVCNKEHQTLIISRVF